MADFRLRSTGHFSKYRIWRGLLRGMMPRSAGAHWSFTSGGVGRIAGVAVIFLVTSTAGTLGFAAARAQQQGSSGTQSQPTQTQPEAGSAGAESSSKKSVRADRSKDSHARDFLIRGTVFTDKAYALPGVELRARQIGEKKFRWARYSNSRGEFGIAVPLGTQYELVAHAKGYADQSRTIDAANGLSSIDNLVFTMQPVVKGKK